MSDPNRPTVDVGHAATQPQPELAPQDGTLIFQPGEVLGGTLRIRSVLGAGGMGQVFEAHDLNLDRLVAVKARWPDSQLDALRHEARALAALRHPSLPVVYGFASHNGHDYLVLERIFGITLGRLVHDAYEDGAPIGLHRALDLLMPVADALVAVHAAGLAHRDIKPLNVMLSPDGRVVLVDFGLVLPEASVATDRIIAGSLPYMAPETVLHTFKMGSARLIDVYGLGVSAFEVLTGTLPRSIETTDELLTEPQTRPAERLAELRPDLPASLAELIGTMMSFSPADRPDVDHVLSEWRAIRRGTAPATTDKHWRVLVVDDDPAVLRVVSFYAKRALGEAEVLTASSGKQALAMLAKDAPDVMLLDMSMPVMNGVEVYMYMRGAHLADQCKVIAVSATVQEVDAQLLGLLGVDRCVTKGPGLADSLGRALSSVLGIPLTTKASRGSLKT